MQAAARESIWDFRIPLSAAIALALFAFLLGYGMGGLEAGTDSFAAARPEEARLARLLIWGALLTIGWASRKPLREMMAAPQQSPVALALLAFVPVTVAELAASRFAVAISPVFICDETAPHVASLVSLLPRSAVLGSTALLSLLAWGRHLSRQGEPIVADPLPQPLSVAHGASEDGWLTLPEAPFLRLRACEVSHIRSAGNYSEILASGRVHLVRATLSDLAERFAAMGFVRIHRQTIVSCRHVRQLYRELNGRPAIELSCGTVLAIGRSYRSTLDTFGS